MNEVRGVNHFTTQVPAAPVTYGRRTGPFKPSLLGRLSPRLEACWTTFPRVPRDRCAGALGKLGVSLLRRNRQVIAVLPQPVLLSSLSRSLNSSSSPRVCVSLQARLMASPLRFDGRVVLVTGAGGGEYAKARGPASSSGPGSARSCSCDLSIWAAGSGGGAAWGASDWTRWG